MSEGQSEYMLAQCGVYDKPLEVTRALRTLAENFPVVAPGGTVECHVVPEGYGVSVTAVVPREDDVYKDSGSGQTCFKAAFLKKLAAGLGIEWIPSETRRLDNFAHPFVCSVVVAGRYRDWSGEWRTVTGSHMLDLRDEAAHGMTPKQLPMARKNIAQLCETKAKSRAIADACISRTISPRDLNRPIPMAKLYRREPIDPSAARSALYGGSRDEPIETHAEVIDASTGEVTTTNAQGNPGGQRTGAFPSTAPAAPHGNVGASSEPPASPEPSPKPYEIPKRKRADGTMLPDAGKAFALASTEALRVYLDDLMGQLGRGDIPPQHRAAAEAKAKACGEEIDRRTANEAAPW